MKKRIPVLVALFLSLSLLVSLAGCGQPAQSTAQNKIVLGVPTALGTVEGKDSLNSVNMAVDEINAAGGVEVGGKKYQLSVVSIDTREAEAGIPVNDALTAVDKLISQNKPNAIVVGAFRSEVLLASMDLVAKYKIPYITSIGMAPDYEKKIGENYDKYKYFFRMGLNSTYLVDYLNKTTGYIGKNFNFNKVYFMYQDVAWAKGTAAGVAAWAKSNGWTIVGQDSYPTGASDFSSSLAKAKAGGAQLIVPIFDMPQAGVLVKQAKSMQVPALLEGFISPVSAGNAWTTFNGEIDGFVNFVYEAGPIPLKNIPKSAAYNDAYAKKYGEDARVKLAGHGPGPAYDSVYVLVDAIKRANSLDSGNIVSALEKTDYDGVIGHIKFSKNHQVIYGENAKETASGLAFQWRAGKRVVVFPADAAESQIQLPQQ